MELSTNEAIRYNGGAKLSLGVTAVLTAIGALIMGIVDGLLNPKMCSR